MRWVFYILIGMFMATAITACTLTTPANPTPAPPPVLTPLRPLQVNTAAPTPFPTPAPVTQNPAQATPLPTATPDPSQPADQTENIVEAIINRLLIPAWNFIYTFITGSVASLWEFAGARGGVAAQVVCCFLPATVVGIIVFLRFIRRGR